MSEQENIEIEERFDEFIKIMIEEDKEKNCNFNEKLKSFLLLNNNLVDVMINLDDIDYSTPNISVGTKIKIYESIFWKEMYHSIINATTDKNDIYFRHLVYGGIICEIVKYNLYQEMNDHVLNKEIRNDEITNDQELLNQKETSENVFHSTENLVKKSISTALKEKMNEKITFIQELYDDSKMYFPDSEIYQDILYLIKNNDIDIFI